MYGGFLLVEEPLPHYKSAASLVSRIPGDQKTQLYQHSPQWIRTISARGGAGKSEKATLPAFGAMGTHDLRRGLRFEIRKRNFTGIPCTRHARSLRGFHLDIKKKTLPVSRATNTFHLRGRLRSESALDMYELHVESMFQKRCACHEIKRNAARATQKHPKVQVPKLAQPFSGIEPFDHQT